MKWGKYISFLCPNILSFVMKLGPMQFKYILYKRKRPIRQICTNRINVRDILPPACFRWLPKIPVSKQALPGEATTDNFEIPSAVSDCMFPSVVKDLTRVTCPYSSSLLQISRGSISGGMETKAGKARRTTGRGYGKPLHPLLNFALRLKLL